MVIELSEEVLGTFVPIVVYWICSGIYGLLGYFDKYRLHPKGEEHAKNIASKWVVLRWVLFQQAFQIAIMFAMLKIIGDDNGIVMPQPSFPVMACQFLVAMVVFDTLQYFGHRYMHVNKFLYKHVHSTHHALVVPYAYGTLYNNPIEGLNDTIHGAIAFLISGMTPRTSIYFFSFVTIKSVDAHSGLWLPWNPLNFFHNNCAFHDIHHQLRGNKYNFAQPFFVTWDKILGTYMPFTVEKREGGGFEACPTKKSKN